MCTSTDAVKRTLWESSYPESTDQNFRNPDSTSDYSYEDPVMCGRAMIRQVAELNYMLVSDRGSVLHRGQPGVGRVG